jgi:hypothetical protein
MTGEPAPRLFFYDPLSPLYTDLSMAMTGRLHIQEYGTQDNLEQISCQVSCT